LQVLHVVEDARGIACTEARSWRRVRLVVIGDVLEEDPVCA